MLVLVPLDDRPVTADLPAELARAAGARVRVPPRGLLGGRRRPADVRGVWTWLERWAAGADAAVVSVEMLCCGGLVASRQTQSPWRDVEPWLARLADLAARVPTYAFSVIPRSPAQPTEEDAAYWTSGDAASAHRHRQLFRTLHARLIEAAGRGVWRYLLVGQDDAAPGSPAAADRDALQALADARAPSRALVTTGADELAARLVARWLVDLTRTPLAVKTLYTFPAHAGRIPRYEAAPLDRTVAEHVASVGGRRAKRDADLLLWVHNFEDRQREARDQGGDLPAESLERALADVRDAVRRQQVVAVADVRFANGADRALVARLLREPSLAGVAAYAGWNTCSNALGSALAQAVVVALARRGVLDDDEAAARRLLAARLLDDWAYQADVRVRLAAALRRRGGDPGGLGSHRAWCEEQAHRMLSERADALAPVFPQARVVVRRVAFPWDRLFEVRIDVAVIPGEAAARRAGRRQA
ncbi:MAG: DUF4127 family protein [Armatimonadota bacterium]|nr:DUF4127 family protein [Armatimonadota bacterium]MDR7403038.1 DUF4127 family protein [Armatimonadota bacterium]